MLSKLTIRTALGFLLIVSTLTSSVAPAQVRGDRADTQPAGFSVEGTVSSVNVPIVLVGTSVGVRMHGGILSHIMQELAVLVDPANIPNKIEVDITELNLGASVHVDDLQIPEGVEVLADMRDTILTVSASKASEEVAAPAEGAAGEPEVIRKTKAEEEAEAKKK